MTRRQPPVATKPPPLAPGHEWRKVRNVGAEDVDQVMARVRDTMTWAGAIARKPHRVGETWLFQVEIARLP